MPEGTPQGQEPTAAAGQGGTGQEPTQQRRTLDSLPQEIQDHVRGLRDESARYRTELRDTQAALKKFEDANKTDEEKRASALKEAEIRFADATTKLLRYEVAASKGLPIEWAGRLQGSTKEELEADVANVKKLIGGGDTSPAGSFDGGPRRSIKKPATMNDLILQATGRD